MILHVETIAKLCHEAIRAYSAELQDYSLAAWEEAPEWQRQSAIEGVRFHLLHPEASASATHDHWLEGKRAEGWRYGPVKDPEKKEHPSCVPYDALPPEQKLKDYLFKAMVQALSSLSPEQVSIIDYDGTRVLAPPVRQSKTLLASEFDVSRKRTP